MNTALYTIYILLKPVVVIDLHSQQPFILICVFPLELPVPCMVLLANKPIIFKLQQTCTASSFKKKCALSFFKILFKAVSGCFQ